MAPLTGELVKEYNRDAARRGVIRLMIVFLPIGSPWLNPIEPRWLHAKRDLYWVQRTPTREELKWSIHQHFDLKNSMIPMRL